MDETALPTDDTPEIPATEADLGADPPPQDDPEPAEETVDVELGGKKYTLPKSVYEEVEKGKDYTQKTQSLAEKERQIAARDAQIAAERESIKEIAALERLKDDLDTYGKVNWAEYAAKDPQTAQAAWMDFTAKQMQRQELERKVERSTQERQFRQHQDLLNRMAEAEQVYAKEIKGWSPEYENKLADHAIKSLGARQQDLHGVKAVPWLVRAIHKAYLYDQTQAAAKEQPKSPIRAVVNGGRSGGPVDLNKVPMEEYVKRETARLYGRRK